MPVINVLVEVWGIAVSALIEVGKIAMVIDVTPAPAVRVIAVGAIGMIEMLTIEMLINVRHIVMGVRGVIAVRDVVVLSVMVVVNVCVIAMVIGMIARPGFRRHERRQARHGDGERPLKQGATGERLLSLFPRLFDGRFC